MYKYILSIITLLVLFTSMAISQSIFDSIVISKCSLIEQADVNTEHLEFSPFFYRDYIGFVFAPTSGEKDKDIDEYYFDLGFADEGASHELAKRASFPNSINSDMHEGPACFNPIDGNLYFTRSFYDKKRGTSRDTIVRKIFRASERNGFKNAVEINIDNDKYHICHPTLNSDGSKLIYASNLPGSSKMDLYQSKFENGKWSDPISLGSNINSIFNEIFPVLYRDSILVFASDRLGGNGGLDMYYSVLRDSTWSATTHLPYPFNSSFDDFGLIIKNDAKSGYFTSNRPGGSGKDDIYKFESNKEIIRSAPPAITQSYSFNVFDKLKFEGIQHASITITPLLISNQFDIDKYDVDMISGDVDGQLILKLLPKKGASLNPIITNLEGIATSMLEVGKRYLISCKADDYEDANIVIETKQNESTFDFALNPKETQSSVSTNESHEVIIPTKKGDVVVFNNLFYDYNSANIKIGAATELDALIDAMVNQPNMKVQLSAHTDARGNSKYNQQLSEQRALSAKKYLVDHGIDQNRIIAIGFGEARIRNQCVDGVPCSEEEHQYNRRTEVKILEN